MFEEDERRRAQSARKCRKYATKCLNQISQTTKALQLYAQETMTRERQLIKVRQEYSTIHTPALSHTKATVKQLKEQIRKEERQLYSEREIVRDFAERLK